MNQPRPPSRTRRIDTRGDIVRIANRLMLTRSYLGLNFQELADEVGVRKASLYHHFASKLAVGLAAVEDSQQRFRVWAEDQEEAPARARLKAYVQRFRRILASQDMVCPIGATAGEWRDIEPELRDAVKRFHLYQLRWLEQQIEEAKLSPSIPAADWAAHFNGVCQGALLSARVQGDPAIYDRTVAPLLATLEPKSSSR